MQPKIAIDVTGAGKPLVFLHGVGADQRIWREVVRRMHTERLLLTPDLPGFGASPPVNRGFDLEEAADALGGALSTVARESFDRVGNSLGGAVAVVLAQRHPELVDRLVLVAPAGFSPRSKLIREPVARLAPAALAGRRVLGTPLMGSGLARRILLWGTVAAPQDLPSTDARVMLQASRRSSRVGAAVSAVLQADLLGELPGLQRPLGLLWGDRDRVISTATMRTILAAYPAATTEMIAGAGHVPQLECPDRFVNALNRLLVRL